jgi:hypothetical protein
MKGTDLVRFLTDSGGNSYTIETIVFNMAITMVLGLFVYFIYKKTFRGVLYSQSFNLTLVIIAMTTAIIIMLIGSNLALSLGMVGALSIVRFRSAIKEPRDLAFLFWAIGVGLAAGTGAFLIAVIGSIFIAVLIAAFGRSIPRNYCYLLVLKGEGIQPDSVEKLLGQFRVKNRLRMENVSDRFAEVTYEVYLNKVSGTVLIDNIKCMPNVREVNLVSFNGEITG